VLKQRTSQHEKTIREFSLGRGGIQLGAPLTRFHGVLTGVPKFVGTGEDLMSALGTKIGDDDA
jgi:circadian clock protein KaiC